MKEAVLDLGRSSFPLHVPDNTEFLSMGKVLPLSHPEEKIRYVLQNPSGSLPLQTLIRQKLESKPQARAVVVISDNTRPVPYTGDSGILYPVVDEMVKAGLHPSQIRLLVATGTHRPMSGGELRKILDPRIFALGLQIIHHDCRKKKDMISVGKTELGGKIFLNRLYMESDIKILTGLVESHFMAGASGGRKSICPGLMEESTTHLLHSGPVLASPNARDLILEGNPVHEEALRVAKMAGCDMNVNVTLDSGYKLTGVFAGDMEKSHLEAFEKLRSYAAIPIKKTYDIAISHTGYVGVNHYQAAKGALQCIPLIEKSGICLLATQHTDPDPVGGSNYKKMMRLLSEKGAKNFMEMIVKPSWTFTPEQWQAQMWTRLFLKIPPKNLIYCTLDIPEASFSWLPETDARSITPKARSLQELMAGSLRWALNNLEIQIGREPRVAFLIDGPYGIPVAE